MIKINGKEVVQLDDKTRLFILRLSMIIAITILAGTGHDGWGWFMFLLIITLG